MSGPAWFDAAFVVKEYLCHGCQKRVRLRVGVPFKDLQAAGSPCPKCAAPNPRRRAK